MQIDGLQETNMRQDEKIDPHIQNHERNNNKSDADQYPYLRKWSPKFAERGRNRQDRPFLKCLEELGVKRNVLEAFLQDTESCVPSQEVQQARKFLRQAMAEKSTDQTPARAWVEYRRKSTENCRVRPEWLTSHELTNILAERPALKYNDSDSIRRLIYIPSFNKDFLTAFATTAYCNEVSALRTVLYRHIAREPTIEVIIPVIGFLTFNLLFSVPYLKLREMTSQSSQSSASEAGGKQFETDLAFLNIDGKDGVRPTRFFIQAAHTTISIFGCDHFEWTGYAFSNHDSNDLDYKHLVGEIEEDEGDGNHDAGETDESDEDEDEDEDEMLNEDRFASDGMNQLLDTFSTIWDPRRYFLRVTSIRIDIILQEYTYIVQTLESGIRHWKKHIIYATSKASCSYDKPTSNRQSLEDTVILKEVLQELRVHLSTTTAAWDDFSGIDGHMDFFSDIDNREAWIAIHTLQESFRKLKGLERRLSILDRHCAESTDVLIQRMAVENNELSIQNNRLSTHTHGLNVKSNQLSVQTHELNLRTSRLTEETTRIALASQRHAEETSRTTRENVQLLLISTPFAFVLQYFCGERNFFSIDRTPKAFVLCLFVLLFALPVINYGVEWTNQHRKRLQHKFLTRLGRAQPMETVDIIEQIVDHDCLRNV